MIKAIYFDFDGVLTTSSTGTDQTCKYISEKYNLDYDLVFQTFKKYKKEILLGTKTYSDILPAINEEIKFEITLEMINEGFLSTPKNTQMLEILKKVKQQGFKVGMITDNPVDRIQALEEKFQFNTIFDSIIVSASVNGLKNESKIFEIAFKSLDVKASESIFIDNSKANLIVPTEMGVQTIYHDDELNDIAGLIYRLSQLHVYNE